MIPAISSHHHSGGTTAHNAIAHTVIAHAGDCDHLILLRTAFTMKIMRRIPPKKIPTLIKSANNFITASTANTAIKMMTANIKFPFRFIFSSLPAVVSPTATLRLRRCMRYPCPMSHALSHMPYIDIIDEIRSFSLHLSKYPRRVFKEEGVWILQNLDDLKHKSISTRRLRAIQTFVRMPHQDRG